MLSSNHFDLSFLLLVFLMFFDIIGGLKGGGIVIHSKYKWKTEDVDAAKVTNLAQELNVSLPLAKMLLKRKITTEGQYDKFMNPSKYTGYDPFLFAEMEKAVERIKSAISAGEKIMIYGDYDADGVTSIAVLYKTLESLGALVQFYIPNRFTEGYGPNQTAFQMIKNQGFDLIITVDNGIAALEVMEFAQEIGMDVIITDHHEMRETLPEAVAVIHPKHPDSNYPFEDLAGVGVSYKLSHALLGEEPAHLLDLVAVGTVADLVSLTDENRLFVQKGLQILRENPNTGLRVLASKAKVKLEEANEETIGFAIAPRLNAIGRLSAADPAAELLLAFEEEEAEYLAEEIDEANVNRRKLVSDITAEATALLEAKSEIPSVILVAERNWNPGVLGIVASRLVDKYHRPVICLAIDDEKRIAKGSGRSVPHFHLYQELDKNRELLEAFGGHPMAAGMTVSLNHLDALERALIREGDQLDVSGIKRELYVEDTLELADVSLEFIQMIEKMAPFGTGNVKPIFQFNDLYLKDTKRIGADKTHLKTVLTNQSVSLDCIGFSLGDLTDNLTQNALVSLVGELNVNEWNNIRKPQLRLVDLEVDQFQLFDARNRTEWQRLLSESERERVFICFNKETVQNLPKVTENVVYTPDDRESARELVFVDLPKDVHHVEAFVKKFQPERIYVHFGAAEDAAFQALPDRKAFKDLYALIKKYQPFSLEKYGPALNRKFGWSKGQIDFMSNVFFELDFVKIESGVILLNDHSGKRNLEEAEIYQSKKQELATREKLLYASFNELFSWMKRIMEA